MNNPKSFDLFVSFREYSTAIRLSCLLSFWVITILLSQGETIAQQTEGNAKPTVFKDRIKPNWFADNNQFWYRNRLPDQRLEYILVDAVRGERKAAFDHSKIAEALSNVCGKEIHADQLDLDELRIAGDTLTFRLDGKSWRCNLATYDLSEIEGMELARDTTSTSALHPDDAPWASKSTGAEMSLRFLNRTNRETELFWLDGDGRQHSYGKLAAGAERQQHTYAGHVWMAIDSLGNTVLTLPTCFDTRGHQPDAFRQGAPAFFEGHARWLSIPVRHHACVPGSHRASRARGRTRIPIDPLASSLGVQVSDT